MFKGIGNLASLLKNAQNISGKMQEFNEELKKRRVTGRAGGGMVEIELSGLMEAINCRIDPGVFGQGDRELIEDLIVAALNDAILQGKHVHAEMARSLTGGISLPGLDEALAKFTGEEEEEGPGDRGQGSGDSSH
jgi:nucleoid-associated protein EbfC